jgi:hypothetical protein
MSATKKSGEEQQLENAVTKFKQFKTFFEDKKSYNDLAEVLNSYELKTFYFSDFNTLQTKYRQGVMTPQFFLDHYPNLVEQTK